MLAAIRTIATQQASATKDTMKAVIHLLNYCATHPEAVVRYHASDMVLHVESDALYLFAVKACSRAAGYHFLSDPPSDPLDPNAAPQMTISAINILCTVMRKVLAIAAEAKLAALFHNGRETCPLRTTLEELGHTQPATLIQTNNSTAAGIANDTVKQK
jgi:hypothetical protein